MARCLKECIFYYINCSGIASGSKSRKMVSHMCDIIFYQSAHRVCHVTMLNGPRFIDIKSKHLRIFLGNLRESSEIFGHFRRTSENVRKHSYDYRTTFSEIFGNLRKMVGNLRKIVKNLVISRFIK